MADGPDWQEMFHRYVDVVGRAEGVDFLYTYEWTEQEWRAIHGANYSADQHAADLRRGGPHRAGESRG